MTGESRYNIATLSNGMRIVHCHTEGKVAYTGVIVNAGTRDESPDKHGLAHFVEHTIFKGTHKRNSLRINNRMEEIGGELNAYTSKEETVIYTSAPAGYSERSIELLSDLICNPTFPVAEVEREKDVVIEEIKSYLDNPGETAFDEFDEEIYRGSNLGHKILGTPESVERLKSSDCSDFIEKFYTPGEMVAYCLDPTPSTKIFRLFEKYFGSLNRPDIARGRQTPRILPPFNVSFNRNGHQAHTIVGSRIFGRHDARRFPMFLLSNYLGGPNLSSLLNQELREKRGYVYTVESNIALLSDCGIMQIYFGCSEDDIKKCRRIIDRELTRLAETPMKPKIFERIKRQYAGQLLVSSDHRESVAMSLGKSLLYYGEVHDPSKMADRIMAVTAQEVLDVAQLVIPASCSSLTLH